MLKYLWWKLLVFKQTSPWIWMFERMSVVISRNTFHAIRATPNNLGNLRKKFLAERLWFPLSRVAERSLENEPFMAFLWSPPYPNFNLIIFHIHKPQSIVPWRERLSGGFLESTTPCSFYNELFISLFHSLSHSKIHPLREDHFMSKQHTLSPTHLLTPFITNFSENIHHWWMIFHGKIHPRWMYHQGKWM